MNAACTSKLGRVILQ